MAVIWHGDKVLRQMEAIIEAKMDIAAEYVRKDIQDSMRGAKSGRIYKLKKKFHQASAPGEAPATIHGQSGLQGIMADKIGRFARRVGTNLKYGLYLELGTSLMKARPWARPALDRQRSKIQALFRKKI